MSLQRDVQFLHGLELFRHFDEEQLKLIAFNTSKRNFDKGKVLFRQGDRALGGLVVVAGEVGLQRAYAAGEASVDEGRVGVGAILGELSLMADVPRHVTATALADTQVIEVPRLMFRRLLSEYPDIAVSLHDLLAHRLAAAAGEIGALAPRFQMAV